MDLGLSNKVAMVGGASKGLGYAVARALAGEGARVSIASRDGAALQKAADALSRETGSAVLAVPADLSRADDVARWHAQTVERFSGVDLLFANTGGPPAGTALAFDDRAWQSAFELLLMSVVRAVRLVVPSMRSRGGGSILVGTSSTVKEPFPNLALSNVMRAGVTALVKTLAGELAPERIRVNTLLPGRIATDRLKYLDEANAHKAGITTEMQRDRALATIPMGRYGDPDDFGRAGAFLLSDAAAYITGAALQIDGGLIRGLL
ncbi:MAG TPA: SDR family oxidoreductase [Vicinamibacterales bacterium]|nr:SDR family oxidoreductase [Vicinamibacterales bacterium]